MQTYVALLNWTDQGIRDYPKSTQRADAFSQMVEKFGGRTVSLFWTIGTYDLVAVVEAPDAETVTAALLRLGALGNVRTTTMRAFGRDEMTGIIAKAGAS
ncbi:uncharacterized protein with GYD domain [Catenulispora sp. MAP12-49]|uniref:GYD domain-containing protein n=1 Tax=unclassified Catenulispora TaxID=414885 RepID=UPI0035183147